jgi:hypothetical protein
MCKLVQPAVWLDLVVGCALGAEAVMKALTQSPYRERRQLGLPQHGMFAPAGLREQAVELMSMLEHYLRSMGAAAVDHGSTGFAIWSLLKLLHSAACFAERGDFPTVPPPAMGALVAMAAAAGPGSTAQQQLHGLLTSALKVTTLIASRDPSKEVQPVYYSAAAAMCAARLISERGAAAESAAAAGAGGSSGSGSISLMAGVVYLGLQDPPLPEVPCDPLGQLPWAVLYGRCCLLWAQQLEQELPQVLESQREAGGQQTWRQVVDVLARAEVCLTSVMWLRVGTGGIYGDMGLCTRTHKFWLEDRRVADRLSAAGYQPQQVLQALEQLLEARQATADSNNPGALKALVQALQAAGQALGCLATPICCNNPCCSSVASPSELQSVSGKGCICAGCCTARYCDRACQRAHWKRHKPVCQALAAAAAATPGRAGAGQLVVQA